MSLIVDVLICALTWFPAVIAGYLLFSLMRFPDLSLEVTWALGGIVTLLVVAELKWFPALTLGIAPLVGAGCALLTYLLFRTIARQKLLAGLIAYFILLIVGSRLLDDSATIRIEQARFGFENSEAALGLWAVLSGVILGGALLWERSRHGIRSRMIGETNDDVSVVFAFRSDRYYLAVLVMAGAAAAIGGAAFSLYNGSASNAQGIGVLIKAIFGALAGDRFCQLVRLTRRSTIVSTPIGAALLALVLVGAEEISLKAQNIGLFFAIKDTDKQALIGVLLLLLLIWKRSDDKRVSDL
jgi:putative ABC transport system permease protein